MKGGKQSVSNFIEIKKEIKNYLIARVPLIVVDSSERERVERILRDLASELSAEICYYTEARQVERFGRSGGQTNVDSDPVAFAASEFRKKRGCIFALGDVRRVGEDCLYSRELLNTLYLAQESNSTMILITPDPVWQRLSQFGMITRLDFPDLEERSELIQKFVQTYNGRFRVEWEPGDVEKAAALLRGFSEIQIENILASTLVSHGRLGKAQVPQLTKQKSRLYSAVSTVEEIAVPDTLQVAGLENLLNWLEEKQNVFFASDDALADRGLETPRGILLAGIPGCGKSLSAKMVAKAWSLPLFRFDIGSVYDKWVGESEKKMREALRFLDNVAPCVVWIDEIEKGLAVSDGGNDTGRRVLGQFLFWLQESNSRIFLVATANEVDMLPPELFRKGRFSETFFVDLPNPAERRQAIMQYSIRSLHWKPEEDAIQALVSATEGFSYADIEYSIKELAQQALLYGDQVVTLENLLLRLSSVVPFSGSNPDAVSSIRRWGTEKAVPASKNTGEVSI